MDDDFVTFFKRDQPARDKYLARLFGLFSERVVHAWCARPEARFEDLGRPTIRERDVTGRGSTLDFTFRDRASGLVYVAELKCELEYENYRYLRLTTAAQLLHHTQAAFQRFLHISRAPAGFEVRVRGKPQRVDGAILVWGSVASEGRADARDAFGFADVLSIDDMLQDLRRWSPAPWIDLIQQYRDWSNELFGFLEGDHKRRD